MGNLYAAWTQGRENGAARAKQSQLATLMGPAMQGDAAAQSKLFGVDAQAGLQAQSFSGTQKKQAEEQFGKLSAVMAQTKNQQYYAGWRQAGIAAGALPATTPEQITDPAEWDGVFNGAQQIGQVYGSGGGNKMFSQKVADDGTILNTMDDGRVVPTSFKADRQAWFRDNPGMAPELVGKDGIARPVGQGYGAPPPMDPPRTGTVQDSDPVAARLQAYSQRIHAMNLPPAIRDQLLDAYEQDQGVMAGPPAQQAPMPTSYSAPPPQYGGGNPRPSEAQVAASVEDAKIRAGLNLGPQVAQQEAQAAAMKAQAEAEAKAVAERNAQVATRTYDADSVLGLLDVADGLIGQSTGSGLGNAVDSVAGFFGKSLSGAEAISQLQTIAGQLISRMPKMTGPQSDKDVLLYKQMAGDLANPNLPRERRAAAAKTIRQLNEKYASGATQGQGRPAIGSSRQERTIVRTGTLNGRKVVQFSDGTSSYAD